MIKRYMAFVFILLLFFVYTSFAETIQKREDQKHGFLGASIGYSRYFVDPDINLNLSGPTMDMRWVRQKKARYPIWGFESSEKGFNFLYSKVLNGRIDVNDISVAYVRRYNFGNSKIHPYIGFDTGLSWLFSGKKSDIQTGYVLKTGIRPCLNINTGTYYQMKSHLAFGLNLKYSFSVKRVYLHNPLSKHKHEDIFHYLSLGMDMKLGSRGIRSIVADLGIGPKFIALDNPTFVSYKDVDYLQEKDEVIGVVINDQVKAYSLKTVAHHHIIHDKIGDMPVLVTFCPLTYTAMVFDRMVDGKILEFDVEGGLIDNNMIMMDRQTKSKWPQLTGEAIKGKMKGKKLKLLNSFHTSWETWKKLHPDALLLSNKTGFKYNYDVYPLGKMYLEYKENLRIMFPLSREDERFHPKEVFLALEIGDTFKAYRLSIMGDRKAINDFINDNAILVVNDKISQLSLVFSRNVDGKILEFEVDESNNSYIKDCNSDYRWNLEGIYQGEDSRKDLKPIPSLKVYWFAWAAFHPNTLIYGQ